MNARRDEVILLAIAVLAKLLFLVYCFLLRLAPWFVLGLLPGILIALVVFGWCNLVTAATLFAVLIALALAAAYQMYSYTNDNLPDSVGAKWAGDRIRERFIAWIGTLKVFCSPLCFVQEPGSYKIQGSDIRELLDGEVPLLRPGDILLRGYDGYVDGELTGQIFLPCSSVSGVRG
ncbi:MAG: hypothetical protein NT159_16485 [Proteobacteria bacterium]|nr:hypothetical protein [Pseudomonadota bacterium]